MKRLLLICVLLSGCSSDTDLSAEYEQIKVGMTYDEAVAILGEPTGTALEIEINPGVKNGAYMWEWGGDSVITLGFQGGKLAQKSIVDP